MYVSKIHHIFKSVFVIKKACVRRLHQIQPCTPAGLLLSGFFINKSVWKHGISYSISFTPVGCCTSTSSCAPPSPLLCSKVSWKKEPRFQLPGARRRYGGGGAGALIGSSDPTRALEDRDGIK